MNTTLIRKLNLHGRRIDSIRVQFRPQNEILFKNGFSDTRRLVDLYREFIEYTVD